MIILEKEQKEPNRLIKEKSPYLLQHAYNPVDWYHGGEKRLSKKPEKKTSLFFSQSDIRPATGAM